MRSSQKHNSDCGLADAVVSLLNFGLKQQLDHLALDTYLSLNLITDLFNHDSTKRMPNEYHRSAPLLNKITQHLSFQDQMNILLITHIIFLALVHQAAKQTLGMINNVCSGVPKCCISVVSKCHDPSIRNVLWEEVFEPEGSCLAARPGALRVSIETMDRNDTGEKT